MLWIRPKKNIKPLDKLRPSFRRPHFPQFSIGCKQLPTGNRDRPIGKVFSENASWLGASVATRGGHPQIWSVGLSVSFVSRQALDYRKINEPAEAGRRWPTWPNKRKNVGAISLRSYGGRASYFPPS
jgi:hypothetical protein